MTSSEIERRLFEIVRKQMEDSADTLPPGTPTPSTWTRSTLLVEAGIDSLGALSILFAIEEAFNISIPTERARAIKTFGDMIDVVGSLVPASQ
jgi:acyl carrier protein